MEQHVLQVLQADLGEFLRHGLTNPLEYRDRDLRQLTHDSGRLFRRGFGDRAQADRVGEDLDGLRPRKLARQAMATVRNGAGAVSGRTSMTPGA